MIGRNPVTRTRLSRSAPPRIGLFGQLGSGNSGNDASMETVLAYLRQAHPDAFVDALCGGPENVRGSYGIDAAPLSWYKKFEKRSAGIRAPILKVVGKFVDTVRIVSWVRRHDAVIVPGAGVLETTLPLRASGFPYALFLLVISGRLFGTKVALVSVGADLISKRTVRWLSNATARLATYRSYRDEYSRDAMRRRGVERSSDRVYPDLVFGIPTPPYRAGDPHVVGVGVMAYYGGNDDRRQAAQIHSAYVTAMTRFTEWLIDNGHQVLLFGGDRKFDYKIAQEIRENIRRYRPDLEPAQLTIAAASTYRELIEEMANVRLVVATRYHNVMCALKLCKPTISLGYSRKFVALMTDMGLAEFHQFASSADVEKLIGQFKELDSRQAELRQYMGERNAAHKQRLAEQFAVLSVLLLSGSRPAETGAATDGLARSTVS
jgi:polysaccharide pyruvyl transferase WcaK-like protein